MPSIISLFLCFLLSLISIFGTKIGLFGVIVFIPFLLIVPGYLLINLIKYEIESKLKEFVIYITISISITIIVAFVISKFQKAVNYDIIILVISIISMIMEIILGFKLLPKKVFVNLINKVKIKIRNTIKILVSNLNKSNLSKGIIIVLVITGLCFPLFIRRDAETYYSFWFTEDPPKTAYSASVIFNITIGSLSEINSSITVQIQINETIFLEEEIYTGNEEERIVQFQTIFTENGQYTICFDFYKEKDSQLNQIGELLHWIRIIT